MVSARIERFVYMLVFLVLLVALAFLLAQKINLFTADLGRHIQNGHILWQSIGNGMWSNPVLDQNTYSYTYPSFPAINHHWASGILFYLIAQVTGFNGLSVFYILLLVASFAIVVWVSARLVGWRSALIAGMSMVPLIAYRNEVRPEGFTYFFAALYIGLVYYWAVHPNTRRIWLLPLVQIAWVNSHIYFFLGPAIVGTYVVHSALTRQWTSVIRGLILECVLIVASLVSPLGFSGVLYPFTIFSNYGYRVLENQTVWFLRRLGMINPTFIWFEVCVVAALVLLLILGMYLVRSRSIRSVPIWVLCLAFGGVGVGLFAVRNFALFGLFTLPIFAYGFWVMGRWSARWVWLGSMQVYVSIVLLLGFGLTILFYPLAATQARGVGIVPGALRGAEFIKQAGIQGPIFNNYDIGGYLIYNLYPKIPVFVDNRPEAYPKAFFQDTYIPMQEDKHVWLAEEAKYKFNAVAFYYHDATPWAQTFLATILGDSTWAPVYADAYMIILLKRTTANESIIRGFELPRSLFQFRS